MNASSARQVWQAALGQLQMQVNKANYETWLRDTVGVAFSDGYFVVGAPTSFVTEWLEKRLRSLVKKTLMAVTGRELEVEFQVHSSHPPESPSSLEGPWTREGNRPEPRVEMSVERNHQPPPRLNPKYTFDSFIVGSNNRLAHAAAVSVGERPGQGYNPLFIYGGVGLGKTHLLHAVGHAAHERGHRVLYVSSEHFTNEFINAIREGKTEEFRNKYRSVDLLLIDDIQFLAGKEQTQEGLFHTFNDLHNASRQIVLSSDRPPRSMPLMEERLRSRFEWGLIADIQPPDLETRLAILRFKADQQKAQVSPEVLDFIARKSQSNIRELEGYLNRAIAYARLSRTSLTVELATQALSDMSPQPNSPHSLKAPDVIETVARHFNLTTEDIKGQNRRKEIVRARWIAMYLLREEAQRSLTEIGNQLGGRDHTTVLHGCRKVAEQIAADTQLRRDVLEIKENLYMVKR